MNECSVMRRLAVPQPTPEPPATPVAKLSRAMRRACDKWAGLDVQVAAVEASVVELQTALEQIDRHDLMIELEREGSLVGVVTLSREMRGALVEAQTLGSVSQNPAEERAPSATDAALCLGIIQQFIDEALRCAAGTSIEGWFDGINLGNQLRSSRILELGLTDETIGTLDVDVKIAETSREGKLRLITPAAPADAPAEESARNQDWIKLWQPVATSVQAKLEAVLHRAVMGFAEVEDLKAGDCLPLIGASVADLRMIDASGHLVARGRLGKLSGNRAVRIETTPDPEMTDLDAAAPAELPGEEPAALPPLEPPVEPAEEMNGGLEPLPDISGGDTLGAELPDLPDMPDMDLPDLPDMPAMELPPLELGEEPAFEVPDLPPLEFD